MRLFCCLLRWVLELVAGFGAPVSTVRNLARLLLARDQPGDREREAELLAAALSTAKRLGMTVFGDRVGDDLARSDGNGYRARAPLPAAGGTGHGLASVPV